jgi:predicted DNA-binding helix-hairpin-helix protein
MPGAERDQLYRAMQLADRISVNLEAPTQERLNALAPKKDFTSELLNMLTLAKQIKGEHPDEKLANTVTQFVVGAVGDTDLELLSVSERLHRQLGVVRAYYSAFNPVMHTPLENMPATPPIREFRLYQSSFLLRDYKWDVEDLPFTDNGNLRTDVDPKRAWADLHLRHQPVEIMTASREQLMRVPHIGPLGADAIIAARRKGRINDLSHLHKLGIRAPEQAAPYILLSGRKPPTQLSLF